MEKLFIWGVGERGKIIANVIGINHVMGFIDSNIELHNTEFLDRKVFSIDDYENKYKDYFIIVTPKEEDDILKELKYRKIDTYFRMSQVPSEMQGYGIINFWNYIEFPPNKEQINVIYGVNLYAYMLYCHYIENGYEKTFLCVSSEQESDNKNQITKILGCKFIPISQIDNQSVIYNATRLDISRYISNSIQPRIVDLFDLSDLINVYHNPSAKKIRNIHKGKRCFIVATGPSLRIQDLEILSRHNEITFGLNRIFNVDEKIWKPTYYAFFDRLGLKQYWDDIAEYSVETKFLGDAYIGDRKVKGNVCVMHAVTDDSYNNPPKFSENLAQKVYAYGTVTYIALQIAVYMGFNEIYLLGVDCNYSKNSTSNYFYNDGKEDNTMHNIERMLVAYRTARRYADTHNISIKNATRGGMLEEFERVSFDELFID